MIDNKPLVSFLLFAYKQEKFIRDAVRGALSQTYEPLEIILSDDCSPDRTFEIIKEEAQTYRGPHRVFINRNESNLGLACHINRVFEMAKGNFFIIAAGDDISVPERSKLLVNRWLDKSNPVDLVCSYFEEINVEGQSTGFIEKNVVFTPNTAQHVYEWMCGATGACASFDRMIYDKYGPLDRRIIAEDWIFSFRAWLGSGIGLIENPLVKHRTHDQSLSGVYKNIRAAENDTQLRRNRRMKSLDNRLARAIEWSQAWQLSGKQSDRNIRSEIQQWVDSMLLERHAYEANPLKALKYAILALSHHNGLLLSVKILIRHVLRLNY